MEEPTLEKNPSTDLKPRSRKWVLLLVCLTLSIAVIVALSVGYLWKISQIQWQQIHQQMVEQDHRLQVALSQTQTTLNAQKQQWITTQDAVKTLVNNQPKQADFTRMQVDAFVKQAVFHLTFEKDIPLALQCLEAADRMIATSQDLALLPVRKALAEKIAILKTLPIVDVVGIVAKLSELSLQAEKLPQIPVAVQPDVAQKSKKIASEPVSTTAKTNTQIFLDRLEKLAEVVWRELSNMVVITKSDQLASAWLSEDQRASVMIHLQAKLDLVQWAVIHQREEIYQQNLSQVDYLLRHYFSEQNIQVRMMLKTLAELKAISVHVAVPNIE